MPSRSESNRRALATLAAGVLLAAGPAAHAASLSAFAGVVAGPGNGNIGAGCTTSGPPSDVSFFGGLGAGMAVLGGNTACGYSGGWHTVTSTGSTATLTNAASLGPTHLGVNVGGYFDGTASAHANYGVLGASAYGHQDVPGYDPTAIAVSSAAATFSDTLTATVSNAYTHVSTAGFVSYRFEIDGHISTPGAQVAYFGSEALTGLDIQNDHGPTYTDLFAYSRKGTDGTVSGVAAASGWTTGPGSVSGGTTFTSERYSIDLTKSWDVTVGLIADAYASADNQFSTTARLVGVELYDYQGTEISGFTLSAASGTNYIAAVPEPASALLMPAGLLGLALAAVRRRLLAARSARSAVGEGESCNGSSAFAE